MADPNQAAAVEQIAQTALEAAVPALAPFHPLISLVATAIMAHFNATQSWPTEEQIRAALPMDYQRLVDVWANWKPSGDGTLKQGL